jgi:Skp family chaperone for outer membrane proteins
VAERDDHDRDQEGSRAPAPERGDEDGKGARRDDFRVEAPQIQDLLKQAEPKIAALAKAEGVSLILDQSATLWADPSVDLTQKLNAEMK